MKQLSTLVLILLFTPLFSQKVEVPQDVIKAIEKDIWIPFMEAYDESDSDKLKSIHTKDIVRITLANDRVETGESYLEGFGNFVENIKSDGGKLGIAFAILSTAINEDKTIAYQTGYYRFSSKYNENDKFSVRGYGHFSVGLKKMDGIWKIWLDSDKRIDITDDDFNNQEIKYELTSN